jgi:hypothetical protein
MFDYTSLIDPCGFGTIADSLRNPQADIDYLVHVKTAALLPILAEVLDRELCVEERFREAQIKRRLLSLLNDGSIRISTIQPQPALSPELFVDPASIPRTTTSHVIHLPPFYLVHTPGLFEGKLVRPKVALPVTPKPAHGIKI